MFNISEQTEQVKIISKSPKTLTEIRPNQVSENETSGKR